MRTDWPKFNLKVNRKWIRRIPLLNEFFFSKIKSHREIKRHIFLRLSLLLTRKYESNDPPFSKVSQKTPRDYLYISHPRYCSCKTCGEIEFPERRRPKGEKSETPPTSLCITSIAAAVHGTIKFDLFISYLYSVLLRNSSRMMRYIYIREVSFYLEKEGGGKYHSRLTATSLTAEQQPHPLWAIVTIKRWGPQSQRRSRHFDSQQCTM